MSNFFTNLFSSTGLKRRIASLAAAAIELARSVPQLSPALPVLEYIAGVFGGVGITHAGLEGTLSKGKLVGLSAALSTFILIASFTPSLAVAVPILSKIAAYLGVAGLATGLKK